MWIDDFAIGCEFGKMSQIHVFTEVHPDYYDITKGGSLKFITILQGGGGLPDLLQYYKGGGGLPHLLQYYNGGGRVSRDPKFVLRNIWTAPYHFHHHQHHH